MRNISIIDANRHRDLYLHLCWFVKLGSIRASGACEMCFSIKPVAIEPFQVYATMPAFLCDIQNFGQPIEHFWIRLANERHRGGYVWLGVVLQVVS